MKYTCAQCGEIDHAKDMDAIVKYGKLCGSCLSKSNAVKLKRGNKPKRKPKISVKHVCNECGAVTGWKPFVCDCGHKYFTAKKIKIKVGS